MYVDSHFPTMELMNETKIKRPQEVTPSRLNKYQSQPKFRTLKQQILKIPKVKQILNKDKFVYNQDIEKRIQLIGSLKYEKFEQDELCDLQGMRKNKQNNKNKRHKTNFKIPLTRQNVNSLNNLVKHHIERNQIYKNEQVIFLKQYMQNAPFSIDKLKFMDEFNPIKKRYKQKYPDFKEGVLSKNKLLLEHVILNRNIKRQMKLDQKKLIKENAKKMYEKNSLENN